MFDQNFLYAYTATVTKVTVFETVEGIGTRCGDALRERRSRRLLILMTPLVEAERLSWRKS